jgi:hypothetical protein
LRRPDDRRFVSCIVTVEHGRMRSRTSSNPVISPALPALRRSVRTDYDCPCGTNDRGRPHRDSR